MMKTTLTAIGCLAFVVCSLSQTTTINPTNVRDGETVEYCVTHKKMEALKQNPAAAASLAQDQLIREQEIANGVAIPKGTIYYIPVVFHLLHNGGIEKISDEQIMDALDVINSDYSLSNADAAFVHSEFNDTTPGATVIPSNVEIQFRLATLAPDHSTCFSGITHTNHPISNDGSDGGDQVNAIISGNDVYNAEWPGDEYLNVFIIGDAGGAAGYTTRPSNWLGNSMANGIWILHNYLGSIGTSSTYTSRALTHEIGHWLNLPHPWGSTNDPGLASNCSTDDSDDSPLITDTPNTRGSTSCNLNEDFCGPRANVENYMDYSYCSKMFTPGQTVAMRSAINSNVANRDNLITAGNHADVGATGTVYLCAAAFEADRTTVCAGDVVNFDDQSFNVVNGWTWTFDGGTPSSSIGQNPAVTYDTPGLYTVTLAATDGPNNDTEIKTSYIRVLPAAQSIPFNESFEAYTTLSGIEQWEVDNPGGNPWSLHLGTGYTGYKSAKIVNFGQSAGNFDELISTPVDLSVVSSEVTLSFRYAYKKRYTSNDEWFKVLITADCGENWVIRKTIHGTQLSADAQNSSWTPTTQADWTTVHMTNVTSAYWTDKFRYKFQFESDGGNNLYLDDINIYEGAPSNEIVAVTETDFDIDALTVFPNPADKELNIRFSVANAEQASLKVQDITGKIIQTSSVQANPGSNWVMMNTSELATGMYFLKIQVGSAFKTIQFVVK